MQTEKRQPSPPNQPHSLIGTTLGQFQLKSELGRGGMAVVYKGYQASLDRWVAIKTLPTEFTQDRELVSRFQREADAMVNLNHTNIVRILDRGEDQGHYYFAMEFVEGPSLKDLMKQEQVSVDLMFEIAQQVAEGLAYAHKKGIVHRDIKPANILWESSTSLAKIADFGIARVTNKSDEMITLTQTNVGMGTMNYMAPEQKSDAGSVDGRADIYSLGVVVYEMFTGKLPMGRFKMPSELNSSLPRKLDELLGRCLETDPEDRWPSMEALKAELLVARQASKGGTLVRSVRDAAERTLTAVKGGGGGLLLVGCALAFLVLGSGGAFGVWWFAIRDPKTVAIIGNGGKTDPGTGKTDPKDPGTGKTDPKDPKDPGTGTDPKDPKNPGTGTDPKDPGTGKTDPKNPGTGTDPKDPKNPGTGTDPKDPKNPGTGTDPKDPKNPGTGTDPKDPGTGKTDPKDPGTGTDPKDPKDPGTGTDPKDPKDPGTGTDPKDPKDPGTGTDPKDPKDPGTTTDPKDPKDPGTDPKDPGTPTPETIPAKLQTAIDNARTFDAFAQEVANRYEQGLPDLAKQIRGQAELARLAVKFALESRDTPERRAQHLNSGDGVPGFQRRLAEILSEYGRKQAIPRMRIRAGIDKVAVDRIDGELNAAGIFSLPPPERLEKVLAFVGQLELAEVTAVREAALIAQTMARQRSVSADFPEPDQQMRQGERFQGENRLIQAVEAYDQAVKGYARSGWPASPTGVTPLAAYAPGDLEKDHYFSSVCAASEGRCAVVMAGTKGGSLLVVGPGADKQLIVRSRLDLTQLQPGSMYVAPGGRDSTGREMFWVADVGGKVHRYGFDASGSRAPEVECEVSLGFAATEPVLDVDTSPDGYLLAVNKRMVVAFLGTTPAPGQSSFPPTSKFNPAPFPRRLAAQGGYRFVVSGETSGAPFKKLTSRKAADEVSCAFELRLFDAGRGLSDRKVSLGSATPPATACALATCDADVIVAEHGKVKGDFLRISFDKDGAPTTPKPLKFLKGSSFLEAPLDLCISGQRLYVLDKVSASQGTSPHVRDRLAVFTLE